jgi:hypothetical protein
MAQGFDSVQQGDQWANTSARRTISARRPCGRKSGGGGAVTRSGPVGTSGVVKAPSGDVYAGRDGNVYRNSGGSWQKYDGGAWNSVQRPAQSSTFGQLDRDSFARADGIERASSWDNVRAGGFGGGSFRPSGGGFRGGGFRGGGGRR